MKQKYVFIDRDGVINKKADGAGKHKYVTRWEDFEFLPGALEALKKLKEAGYKSIIISNQRCVGKKIITRETLDDITWRMSEAIERAGGTIEKAFYCEHLSEDNCACRKPEGGLFYMAIEEMAIKSFSSKFFIGDSESDVQAGRRAGLGTILVLSGESSIDEIEKWEHKPDHIFQGLFEAVDFVLENR